ncbi:hypothetical protein I7I53_03394 [Histoplasma capsulatum var. duboisii H88]|uniref:Uncharacterized protein n=1 Tax=Ajellomyces capsulatus (strain H88) TaxID=544711 RepID=A0A8A1LTU2_AJEC8|nr:hypothetical protein I7I53_03394 [Histoplasma capsulatum var. duboisii H88]
MCRRKSLRVTARFSSSSACRAFFHSLNCKDLLERLEEQGVDAFESIEGTTEVLKMLSWLSTLFLRSFPVRELFPAFWPIVRWKTRYSASRILGLFPASGTFAAPRLQRFPFPFACSE